MKTLCLLMLNLILAFWDNLMEELSKMEFSQEGIYIISGIVIFVGVGLIVITTKERIEKKKKKEEVTTQHTSNHHRAHQHHHHHHRHRRYLHKK